MLAHGQLRMHDGAHWEVHLHMNQCYLGRSYIKSKRPGLVDFMDTTPEEREEFFRIATALRDGLTSLFKPDLFNWATLGNIVRQCHMHFVPRYENSRALEGVFFTDQNWNKNWAPYDKDWCAPDDVTLCICQLVGEAMLARL